ncbi:isochorismatase family protein [Sphaerulina musiva SO2202]|uniref:Isochorismatase family protein n=1 Tax=Sphaerulina musiva (strain SO2202) TaxID=692275 RepID=N1QIZ2_SPHMS|nr:isochorismatase family protein [Sphaerulina musiva SO2202]EMF10559.1 isochorismatase family protein [Sphaerulina musiva SO2202]
MSTTDRNEYEHHRAVVGNGRNFWLYSSQTGFDLTHPETPTTPHLPTSITIETTTSPIAIDPSKSALIVIDMQNYFLSPVLGRTKGAGHAAVDQLIEYAVPAARRAGIRVVWVNWGLTDKEVEEMPPAVKRAFGFEAVVDSSGKEKFDGIDVEGFGVDRHGKKSGRKHHGIGSDMGIVKDEHGTDIEAGRVLMRGAWNSALFPPLDQVYEEGKKLGNKPDVWIHKNRMSGMWGVGTDLETFLEQEGIRTLFFTGVNTDQCVGGTLTDSFSKGYDCIMLGDGAATTSPEYAQKCYEFNSANTYGFVTSCKQFAAGVQRREL